MLNDWIWRQCHPSHAQNIFRPEIRHHILATDKHVAEFDLLIAQYIHIDVPTAHWRRSDYERLIIARRREVIQIYGKIMSL